MESINLRYKVIDECRKNLTKYTLEAFSYIPRINNPNILDIGCGTGVSVLALAEKIDGSFHAVDPDIESLNWLKIKIAKGKLEKRIKTTQASVFDQSILNSNYDIVLAEGLLNIIGFQNGIVLLKNLVKVHKYLIVHDEWKNENEKRQIFANNKLVLLKTIYLNSNIWWNEYYECLYNKICEANNNDLFSKELSEIVMYKKEPEQFESIYYILENN